MGSGYNMPDGVYERDIPGYSDAKQDVTMTCPSGHSWIEEVSSECDGDVESYESCEICGEQGAGEFTLFADRADAWADAMADRAERYYD